MGVYERFCAFARLHISTCRTATRAASRAGKVPLAEAARAAAARRPRRARLRSVSRGQRRRCLPRWRRQNCVSSPMRTTTPAPALSPMRLRRARNHHRRRARLETSGACVPTNVDWRDNFCAPLTGSVQYAAASAFADRWNGPLLLTGHSKGGNVALYAQSVAQDARAAVFNAQGFACHALTREQSAACMRARSTTWWRGCRRRAALPPGRRFYVRQDSRHQRSLAGRLRLRRRRLSHPGKAHVALPRRGSPLAPPSGAGNAGLYQHHPPPARLPRASVTQIAWTAPRGRGIMFGVTS